MVRALFLICFCWFPSRGHGLLYPKILINLHTSKKNLMNSYMRYDVAELI